MLAKLDIDRGVVEKWTKVDKREGVKNQQFFADVINGWPLISISCFWFIKFHYINFLENFIAHSITYHMQDPPSR